MKTRDILSDAAFMVAKAGSTVLQEMGTTPEAIDLMAEIDKVAIKLFRIANTIPLDNDEHPC